MDGSRRVGFDECHHVQLEIDRFLLFGNRALVQLEAEVQHADVGELILEVRQETSKVVEVGGAGDGKGGLLVRETRQQIDLRGGADRIEMREVNFVFALEVAER